MLNLIGEIKKNQEAKMAHSELIIKIKGLLQERILILDGGLGTMIQGFRLTEEDYRGERFADYNGQLKGNLDLLNITQPDVLREIHLQYLDAGADIFSTTSAVSPMTMPMPWSMTRRRPIVAAG